MASLFDDIVGQLKGPALSQIGRSIGADEKTTGQAAAAAVTTLIGALTRNATSDAGRGALHQALAKDHDGGVLDDLAGFIGRADQGPGEGILRHVLGDRRPQVEAGIGKASGLNASSSAKLMTILAPVVLGALGRQQRQAKFDAGGLSEFLGTQRAQLQKTQPKALGGLSRLLDSDGDGDVDLSDLASFGKLFGR